MSLSETLKKRNIYLISGVFSMLFSGVLYAWSILKVPFKEDFGWSDSALALNFTVTMCFFCLGAFFGSLLNKKAGVKITLITSGALVGAGFVLTGFLTKNMLPALYITYGFLAATGIGISYNVTVSTVNAWFPDKKGFSSGLLMMGFGVSTLLLGNIISSLFETESIGVTKTYIVLGIITAVVIIASGFILKKPTENTELPAPKIIKSEKAETFDAVDFTPLQMIKSFTFIRAFICMAFITAVGNSVISFARDLMLSVDAAPSLATTLVGVLSVFNGIGRILTGLLFDRLGRKATMISANFLTIIAAGITLAAVMASSLPLCIVGLCLTGISYGSCPTVTSAFTMAFYGKKSFATNYSIMNFNLIFASFFATFSSTLLTNTGSYVSPFIMLLILSVLALGLNFSIKKT